jgi:hypothetical protein
MQQESDLYGTGISKQTSGLRGEDPEMEIGRENCNPNMDL